jgi:pyruvate kinase
MKVYLKNMESHGRGRIMQRKAKIVGTLGPVSDTPEQLRILINAGLDVARMNFSHGSHEDHAERIQVIRQLSEEMHKPITILQDLQGPKLRVGKLPDEGIELIPGHEVILNAVTTDSPEGFSKEGDKIIIPLTVPDLAKAVKSGNRILMDDGNLELEVVGTENEDVITKVVVGGWLKSHKGVNLPGAKLAIPSLTDKDKNDLAFGLSQNVDLVAISFVSTADDVLMVKEEMKKIDPAKADTPVVAKLERPEAIANLEAIMEVTDGVMVARGDLGVETSAASVPVIQKQIIEMADKHNRFVITATQMLDSMIHNPRPTRAEASDVANAIFDGTDAVMLSGETAVGAYAQKSVEYMSSIIVEAEKNYASWGYQPSTSFDSNQDALALSRAALALARDTNVSAIAVFTRSGKTALLVSKVRPEVPILAFTPDIRTYRRMGIYWGIKPFLIPYASSVKSMVSYVETSVISQTDIHIGEQIVIISGYPVGAFKPANLALLHTIGEEL